MKRNQKIFIAIVIALVLIVAYVILPKGKPVSVEPQLQTSTNSGSNTANGNTSNSPIELVAADFGKTINAKVWQPIDIKLQFSGGSGYYGSLYDSSILKLTSHFYTLPPNATATSNGEYISGVFGTDTLEFIPQQAGSTYIAVEASPNALTKQPPIAFKIFVVVSNN